MEISRKYNYGGDLNRVRVQIPNIGIPNTLDTEPFEVCVSNCQKQDGHHFVQFFNGPDR